MVGVTAYIGFVHNFYFKFLGGTSLKKVELLPYQAFFTGKVLKQDMHKRVSAYLINQ